MALDTCHNLALLTGHPYLISYVWSSTLTGVDRALLYHQVISAISWGDTQVLYDILAPDIVDHNPVPMQPPGREGFMEWMAAARRSFPDLWGRVEDVLVSGEFVIGRVTWRGTQRGPFAGLPPTQKQTAFEAIHIVRFDGPTIAEWWGVANLLAAINQLGGKVVLEEPETGSLDLDDGEAART